MLYAINVLKKIIMKEKSYILFWKVKKMWILKHVCLQSTPWTIFCLMKSLCYYCPTFLIPVFSTATIVLLCYVSSSIFCYHSINSDHFNMLFKVYVFLLDSLREYRSSSSSSRSKKIALHPTTLTASLVLMVCFFSLAIIQELSHDCSRANGEPREYLQSLSVKEICTGLGCPMAGFYWDRQFCSKVLSRKWEYKCRLSNKDQ